MFLSIKLCHHPISLQNQPVTQAIHSLRWRVWNGNLLSLINPMQHLPQRCSWILAWSKFHLAGVMASKPQTTFGKRKWNPKHRVLPLVLPRKARKLAQNEYVAWAGLETRRRLGNHPCAPFGTRKWYSRNLSEFRHLASASQSLPWRQKSCMDTIQAAFTAANGAAFGTSNSGGCWSSRRRNCAKNSRSFQTLWGRFCSFLKRATTHRICLVSMVCLIPCKWWLKAWSWIASIVVRKWI